MLLEREENLEDVIKDLEIIMNREKIKQDDVKIDFGHESVEMV